jgi:DNA (cytosine-5)-methyltransferase 1
VGRMADGVAHRVDRLKALGNGQVPLCAATAFRMLTGDSLTCP